MTIIAIFPMNLKNPLNNFKTFVKTYECYGYRILP